MTWWLRNYGMYDNDDGGSTTPAYQMTDGRQAAIFRGRGVGVWRRGAGVNRHLLNANRDWYGGGGIRASVFLERRQTWVGGNMTAAA